MIMVIKLKVKPNSQQH